MTEINSFNPEEIKDFRREAAEKMNVSEEEIGEKYTRLQVVVERLSNDLLSTLADSSAIEFAKYGIPAKMFPTIIANVCGNMAAKFSVLGFSREESVFFMEKMTSIARENYDFLLEEHRKSITPEFFDEIRSGIRESQSNPPGERTSIEPSPGTIDKASGPPARVARKQARREQKNSRR
jgi:hypothetical protein